MMCSNLEEKKGLGILVFGIKTRCFSCLLTIFVSKNFNFVLFMYLFNDFHFNFTRKFLFLFPKIFCKKKN